MNVESKTNSEGKYSKKETPISCDEKCSQKISPKKSAQPTSLIIISITCNQPTFTFIDIVSITHERIIASSSFISSSGGGVQCTA
jgi:hypothetical protein